MDRDSYCSLSPKSQIPYPYMLSSFWYLKSFFSFIYTPIEGEKKTS